MGVQTSKELLEAVRNLESDISERRDSFDADRRLPDDLVARMADAGVFRMLLPSSIGGLELEPAVFTEAIETLARFDGAVGWVAAIIAGTGGYLASMLPSAVAAELLDSDALSCGALAVLGGKAVATDGGYVVSGRWPFGSGCFHSSWFASACNVFEGDDPRLGSSGSQEQRLVVLPASECTILDTWHVSGLRGTGSNDYTADRVFVPEERTVLRTASPVHPGALYSARFYLLAHPAHAIGIARNALGVFIALARSKTIPRSDAAIRERSSTQAAVGEAQGLLDSASAYLRVVTDDLWRVASGGDALSLADRARARSAIVVGVRNAKAAVDVLYEAGGASSIYEANTFERCFRDLHVATQHAAAAVSGFEIVGQVALGVEPRVPFVF